ncbi:hypothetical protein JTB14_020229 [Gonioctena quinquepunctata]|nr:hypothetical protein JTB14_020229 [Gonioctena quinquepunctata]
MSDKRHITAVTDFKKEYVREIKETVCFINSVNNYNRRWTSGRITRFTSTISTKKSRRRNSKNPFTLFSLSSVKF